MKRRLGREGFTMVELCVTMAVIGILAAIAMPNLINTLPKARLTSAARTLSNEIAMLRMSAIARSADAQVVFDDVAGSYSLYKTVGGGAFTSSNVRSFGGLDAPTYLDGTAAPGTLQLNANGTTSVPLLKRAVVITLRTADGSARRRVIVWSNGRINSEKWAGGSTWVQD
jgi:prepilin-type N-terminal cleavage/methylation domain-containing protein